MKDPGSGLVDGFFTAQNAEGYGRFIGERFKAHANIIWILGGDKAAPTDESRAVWRTMARGDGYALVYTPTGRTLDIQLGKLSGATLQAAWFDPRTGETVALGGFANTGRRTFDPPGEEQMGNDWALILEVAKAQSR